MKDAQLANIPAKDIDASRLNPNTTLNTNIANTMNNYNTTNNNSNNTTNNTNNMIVINNYKKPDQSHFTEQDIFKIIRMCNNSVPTLVEKTYFDKDKPENHSVYVKSLNTKYAYLHDGKRWMATIRESLVEQLFDLGNMFLENKMYDLKDTSNVTQYNDAKKSFMRYLNNIENVDVLRQIKEKITLVLFNFRHVLEENDG